jgi:hypothetical protein
MPSPAQQHKMRVLASQAAANAAPGQVVSSAEARAVSLMHKKLDDDRRRLKEIRSTERKVAAKRDMLPEYVPYIDGVIASDAGTPDDIVGFILAWRIDVGDYDGAMRIAAYALKHGLAMPDRFARNPATYIAEEIAHAGLRAQQAKKPFDTAVLVAAAELTGVELEDGADMPDQVKAKLHMALGRQLRDEDPVRALTLLRRAVELDNAVGAKKDIEQIERHLKNNPNTAGDAGNPEQPPPGGA